ncbi:MAG: NAD(P) transhydrogenase subunit alpha [Rickettsiales bacterium]|jgi:NAD(P) transhydrogenase subunit alpha|nr:NAD(P) transhydrogenase subunit alpha [Rickettsiales bacterium]
MSSNLSDAIDSASAIAAQSKTLSEASSALVNKLNDITIEPAAQITQGVDPLIFAISIFVLACFVGYYVVWKVTPALHTPLMAVTNAISGIIIVGAIIALGPKDFGFAQISAFLAVTLAAVNIFGGFVVTQRMLSMFRKK